MDPRRGFHRILPIDAFEHLPPLREVECAILKLWLDILKREILKIKWWCGCLMGCFIRRSFYLDLFFSAIAMRMYILVLRSSETLRYIILLWLNSFFPGVFALRNNRFVIKFDVWILITSRRVIGCIWVMVWFWDFTTYLCFTWSIFSTSLTYKRVSKQRFFCKAKSCNEPTLILFNHSNKRMYCKIQDAQKHPIQAISQ